jgi:hypothetical protein
MKLLKVLLFFAALACLPSFVDAQVFNQWPSQASSLKSTIAPATPAVNTVKAAAGVVTSITCFNLLATPVYINLFDLASGSITLGTTSANYKFMCPGNTAGAGFVASLPWAVSFATGINYSVSGAIALTDNTAITASSVIVNIGFN